MDPPSHALADGSEPATPQALFVRLRELGIETHTVSHPPVFTVQQAKAHRGEIAGTHTKNLFLRDKKGDMWLVVCLEDRAVDLKGLAQRLGSGRLSFGSAERLRRYLGVTPGAVTPFGIVNDHNNAVRVAIDGDVLAQDPLNFHPLDNSMTTSIRAGDLVRFLVEEHHAPEVIDF